MKVTGTTVVRRSQITGLCGRVVPKRVADGLDVVVRKEVSPG